MRKKGNYKKEIEPDWVYSNPVVAKFINVVMKSGKKTVAEKIVYGALERVKEQTKKEPIEAFDAALRNVTPLVELKSRRMGGANYQVPREVRGARSMALAFRWLIGAARAKKGKPMAVKLAEEILLAARNEGGEVKKKLATHRMAEANK